MKNAAILIRLSSITWWPNVADEE